MQRLRSKSQRLSSWQKELPLPVTVEHPGRLNRMPLYPQMTRHLCCMFWQTRAVHTSHTASNIAILGHYPERTGSGYRQCFLYGPCGFMSVATHICWTLRLKQHSDSQKWPNCLAKSNELLPFFIEAASTAILWKSNKSYWISHMLKTDIVAVPGTVASHIHSTALTWGSTKWERTLHGSRRCSEGSESHESCHTSHEESSPNFSVICPLHARLLQEMRIAPSDSTIINPLYMTT